VGFSPTNNGHRISGLFSLQHCIGVFRKLFSRADSAIKFSGLFSPCNSSLNENSTCEEIP
jgi:hypothetical protein